MAQTKSRKGFTTEDTESTEKKQLRAKAHRTSSVTSVVSTFSPQLRAAKSFWRLGLALSKRVLMKTFYSPAHLEHAPKEEFEAGRLSPAVEIPARAEHVKARIGER